MPWLFLMRRVNLKNLKALLNPYKGLPREIYIVFVSRVINALGCFVMPLLTLIMTGKIGLTSEEAGMIISLSGLLFMFPSMIGGKLADTIGRKKVIVIFDMLAIIGYVICAFMEPSMNMVYMIMISGAFMSTAGPAHESLVADITTPDNRKNAYALIYMGWNLGYAFGPFIAGMLYNKYLRIIFLGDAATAFISLIIVTFFIKETIHKTKEDIKDESRAFERREEGSIITVLLKRPILLYFAFIMLGVHFVYSQWTFMLPMQTMEIFGDVMSGKYYGRLASFNGLLVILFTPLMTKLTENIKNIRCMVYGCALYAVGFGMLAVTNSMGLFYTSVFVFTIGEIVLSISASPFIVNHTPASHRGRMNAVLPIIMSAGFMIGPMVMGKIIMKTGIATGWIVIGALGFVCTILLLWLEVYDKRTYKADVETEDNKEIEL